MTTTFPRLIVFGEALTDFIRDDAQHWHSVAGGSCWNVARVGARLGVPTAFAGTVSRDTFGDELMRKSADAGLDMRFIQQVDRAPLLAMVVSKQPPHYFFIGENSADLAFDPADLPAGAFDAADIVHVGSLGVVREPLASRLIELAQAARAAGKRISFDPNFRAPMAAPSYRDTLRRLTALAEWIKVSDEDLRGLFPELDEAAALAQLRAWARRDDARHARRSRHAAAASRYRAVPAGVSGRGGRHGRLRRCEHRRLAREPARPPRGIGRRASALRGRVRGRRL